MERITLQDDGMSAMLKMADGNPGAVTAMMELLQDDNKTDPDSFIGGIGNILSLDTIGIYGTDIYVLWSDICGRDIVKMISLLRGHQLGFITSELLKEISGRQDRSGKSLIDIEDIYKKVCDYLPNFDKTNR